MALPSWPGSYGGFFVNRARRFFSLLAAGSVATGSRTSPGLRCLGQREMSVSGALSRAKLPEAGAEGKHLQEFVNRRPSLGESEGLRGCPSAAPFFDPGRRPVEPRR